MNRTQAILSLSLLLCMPHSKIVGASGLGDRSRPCTASEVHSGISSADVRSIVSSYVTTEDHALDAASVLREPGIRKIISEYIGPKHLNAARFFVKDVVTNDIMLHATTNNLLLRASKNSLLRHVIKIKPTVLARRARRVKISQYKNGPQTELRSLPGMTIVSDDIVSDDFLLSLLLEPMKTPHLRYQQETDTPNRVASMQVQLRRDGSVGISLSIPIMPEQTDIREQLPIEYTDWLKAAGYNQATLAPMTRLTTEDGSLISVEIEDGGETILIAKLPGGSLEWLHAQTIVPATVAAVPTPAPATATAHPSETPSSLLHTRKDTRLEFVRRHRWSLCAALTSVAFGILYNNRI